jgi:protein-S-isoprenylcysteine O-methyltransferase Ste14
MGNLGERTRALLSLLPPAIVMTGALLLGWGVDDLKQFFANPARAAVIAVVVGELVVGTLWRVVLTPFRKGSRGRRRWPIVAGLSTVPLLWVAVSFCDRRSMFVFWDSPAIRWIGVGVFAAGGAIRLAALKELGRQYSAFLAIQHQHQLIRSGIYRRIRHPFYLGGLLNLPGAMLAFRSPFAVLVLVASLAFVVNRIGREEQLLLNEFPETYREYQHGTWRLLPPIY